MNGTRKDVAMLYAVPLGIVAALFLTACTTYHPPASASWAYRGTLKGGVSMVAYAPSLTMCRTMREKDLPKVNPSDWNGTFSECVPITITPGTGWSAFSVVDFPELGIALNDTATCEFFRQQYVAQIPLLNRPVGTGSWMYVPAYRMTKCSSVAVSG
jgi:hypothetical protein